MHSPLPHLVLVPLSPSPSPTISPRLPFCHHPLHLAIATVLSILPSLSLPSHDDNNMITTPSQLSRCCCCCLRLGHLSPPSSLPLSPYLASPSHLITSDNSLDVTCLSGAAVLPPSSSGLSGPITGESPLFSVFFRLVLTHSAVP